MVEAESFLNTDFSTVDETGQTVPVEAPLPVTLWIKNRVAQYYENRGTFINPDYTLLQPHRVYPFKGTEDVTGDVTLI